MFQFAWHKSETSSRIQITPLVVSKGERVDRLSPMLALLIRWDVMVWQWGCGRCGGRILAEITLRFCTAGKGLKLEDSSGQGNGTRKVWQGLAQFALSLCHLAFLAYKEHTALVIAYIQEKMYNHGKAEANPGRTYIRECTLALLLVAQLKDMMF